MKRCVSKTNKCLYYGEKYVIKAFVISNIGQGRREAIILSVRLNYSSSISFNHNAELASLGIRQSPRGLMEMLPTFGPSGKQERLNCWLKKRRKNVCNHFFIVALSYLPPKAMPVR